MTAYERIRAACCTTHGLGMRNEEGRWVARDDEQVLDEHAALVERIVSKAKPERSTA